MSKVQVYGVPSSVFLCPTYGRSCDALTKAVLGPPVEPKKASLLRRNEDSRIDAHMDLNNHGCARLVRLMKSRNGRMQVSVITGDLPQQKDDTYVKKHHRAIS